MGFVPARAETQSVTGRTGAGKHTKSTGQRSGQVLQDGSFILDLVYTHLTFFSICVTMQSEEQQKRHQESQATRLADLELLLKALATKTEVCKDGPLLSLRRHLENMYVDFTLKCDQKTYLSFCLLCYVWQDMQQKQQQYEQEKQEREKDAVTDADALPVR